MSSSWLILCIFLSKICFIFHFHIFCRYCVAQAATFLSCLPGAAKGKWPSSSAFSLGGGWLGLEEIKNCNEQLSVTMRLESNHVRWQTVFLLFLLCSRLMFWIGRKPFFSGVCFTFTRRFAWPLLLSLMHSFPHVFRVFSVPAKVVDFTEWRQLGKQGNHWGFYQSVPQN